MFRQKDPKPFSPVRGPPGASASVPNQDGEGARYLLRVNEQVAKERRRRMKFHARRKGRPLRPRQLVGCDWTIFITNVPEAKLPLSMVRALYTVRWQIELIFK